MTEPTAAIDADEVQRLANYAFNEAGLLGKLTDHDREDVLAQLQLNVIRCIRKQNGTAKASTYFLSFAVKEAKRLAGKLNRKKTGLKLFSELIVPVEKEDETDHFGAVEQNDQLDSLGDLRDSGLSKRDAEILFAVYVYRDTLAECGSRFRISIGRVKQICDRSIRRLQRKSCSGCK